MTAISNNDIARAIYLVLKDNHLEVLPPSGGKTSKYAKVVSFLFRKRILSKASLILSQLGKIINQEESRMTAKISSTERLKLETKTHLEQILKKRYSVREIVLEEKIDAKLLGGLKIEVNNEVIDLSIKNKIGKLQAHLIKD